MVSGLSGAEGISLRMSTSSSACIMRQSSTRSCSRPLNSCTVPRTFTTLPLAGGVSRLFQFQILPLISPERSQRVMSR